MSDRLAHLTFTAVLWEWPSRASWFFVTLPEAGSARIADEPRPPRGFGSVRVRVRIGGSEWTTSIFPGSGDAGYSLPVKASVRAAEGIEVDDTVEVHLELLE